MSLRGPVLTLTASAEGTSLPIDLAMLYQALNPTLFCRRPKTANRYIRCSFEYLLELQSDSLIYKSLQFLSFEYLVELESDSLIYFLWIYFFLFTDRFSFTITGSQPYFILSTLKFRKSLHRKINAFLFLSQKSMHPIFRFLAFFLWISFKIFITVCLFFIWCITHFETKSKAFLK